MLPLAFEMNNVALLAKEEIKRKDEERLNALIETCSDRIMITATSGLNRMNFGADDCTNQDFVSYLTRHGYRVDISSNNTVVIYW